MYKILGTKFDHFFFESETGVFGRDLVEQNIENGIFEKSEGAVIFKGEKYGLHTRVFINSEGLPTYEAKDLGLSKIKFDKLAYDKSIVVTANEQNDYFKVLLKAMSLIYPDLAEKTTHLSHGMLRLPSGKMSSRTGKVVTAISLLHDIEKRIMEKMEERSIDKLEKKQIAEKIAVGALKYSILRQVTGKDIIFDFDKSLSFEGDSGPYLQYAYTRAMSVMNKVSFGKKVLNFVYVGKTPDEAYELEKKLYVFPEIVSRSAEEYSPNFIATYLIELASSFNNFYANEKILDKSDQYSLYKISLTKAFSIVMKNGLKLLGIDTVEKM
jgi:arginyl-tRNA synthetase